MKAKNNNQIREEVKKHLAAKYNQLIEDIKKEKSKFWNKYLDEEKKVQALTRENNELKQKLEALEDWNRRLMEFMDMPDDQRKDAYKQYIEDKKLKEEFSGWFDMMSGYLDWLKF